MEVPAPVVVVPLHRLDLRDSELASLRRLFDVLGRHAISLLLPERLRSQEVTPLLRSLGGSPDRVDLVWQPDHHFDSVRTYNRFLLTAQFYRLFEASSHILIYQADAWVFEDQLLEFCLRDFDYIGAPWFQGLHRARSDAPLLPHAGNGGFSLRRTSAFANLFDALDIRIERPIEMWRRLSMQQRGILRFAFLALLPWSWAFRNTLRTTGFPAQLQEDMFWSIYASRLDPRFKPAPVEEAVQFSWECNPRRLIEMNRGTLPFGCHGWEKYDPGFWRDHIASCQNGVQRD